jgi:hypothetical protein
MFSSPRLRHHVGDDRDALLDGALVERGVAERSAQAAPRALMKRHR